MDAVQMAYFYCGWTCLKLQCSDHKVLKSMTAAACIGTPATVIRLTRFRRPGGC